MSYYNFLPSRRALGAATAAAAALFGFASFSHAQTIVYQTTTAASGTLAVEAGATSFLQPLTLSAGTGTYTFTSIALGVNFNAIGNGQQDIFFSFYNGLNLSPGAANALTGATDVLDSGTGLGDPPAAGAYVFTVTFNTPQTINVGANFGIVFSFVDDASQTFSTEISPLFRLGGAPSFGSNPGFVYNDANQDGAFPGSEQTKFGNATSANYYLRLSASATPVPEPGTWALMAGGLGALLVTMRARRRLA